jgi:hypothetical protein
MAEKSGRREARVSIKTVGEEQLEARFSNHVTATLESRSSMVFMTFSQAAPKSTWSDDFEIVDDIPTFILEAPVIARIAMPLERFREWMDSIIKSYDNWFDDTSADASDEEHPS